MNRFLTVMAVAAPLVGVGWFLQEPAGGLDLQALAEEVQIEVEELRGTQFPKPVKKSMQTKEGLRTYLAGKLEEEYPGTALADRSHIYAAIGLLPPDTDLEAVLVDTLMEQVGGFYEPTTQELFLMEGFGENVQRILMAHELTHALDDQIYDLGRMMDGVSGTEDEAFAIGAVVEGSGTALMNLYTMGLVARIGPGVLMKEMEGMSAMQADQFGAAPAYLQRGLLFTYLKGATFLARGKQMAGAMGRVDEKDLDAAFRRPPLSSEQVLHPEKYWDEEQRDDPVPVRLPDLGGDWEDVLAVTLGEVNLTVLAAGEKASQVDLSNPMSLMGKHTHPGAEGWGGDRLRAWKNSATDEWALVLATVWDTSEDAKEFADAWEVPDTDAPHAAAREGRTLVACWGAEAVGRLDEMLNAATPDRD